MKFLISTLDQRKTSDLLVIPLYKSQNVEWPLGIDEKKMGIDAPIKMGDFKGKEGETSLQYVSRGIEPRVLLLGLGDLDSVTVESLRRSFGAALKIAGQKHFGSLNILVPKVPALSDEEVLRGLAEGCLLTNYCFYGLKSQTKQECLPTQVKKVTLLTSSKNALKVIEKTLIICEGVYLARDLVNGNADDITPAYLASLAVNLSNQFPKIKTTCFDKKQLEKEKFGLILAVSRGSSHDPVLIVSEYKGNPKDKKSIILMGKGVTYDTGGLNLKPTGSMETMKCDMGGAAVVLGVLQVAAALGLKHNITVVIPAVENSISATSYKPGDVYKSYSGKTVEIGNTDAEGRLILADALSYAVKHLNPKEIIDVATLTGAIEIALGSECAGLFCNSDALADALLRAGSVTYERIWRMPIFEEYRDLLKSEIADIRNHGGRAGGAITAALFLKEFVPPAIPWAHLDIAGTAFFNEKKRYHPKSATGIGVRLLIEAIETL